MEIRKLNKSDEDKLLELLDIVIKNLEHQEYFTKIEEHTKAHFLDDNYSEFYGLFDNDKLVACATLFIDPYEFAELCDDINLKYDNVAEIGRAVVHPNYRGNHYERLMVSHLIEVAPALKIKHLVATVHPDNIPSQKCFRSLDFKYEKTVMKKSGYLRDIFYKEL